MEVVPGSFADIIVSKYAQTTALTQQYYDLLLKYLEELKEVSDVPTPVIDNIRYDWPTPDIKTIVKGLRPEPPNIPDIEIPEFPEPPPVVIDYNEPAYQSALLASVKATLKDVLDNGGTGLSAEVEQSMQDRAGYRIDAGIAKLYEDTVSRVSAMGWTIPAGVEAAARHAVMMEGTRQLAESSNHILAKTYDVAVQQSQAAQQGAVTLEGHTMDHFDSVQNRALDAAKAIPELVIQRFTAVVSYCNAKVTAQAEKVKAIAVIYEAEVKGYAVDIQEADIEMKGQIAELNAQIQIGTNKTQILLKAAEQNLQAWLRMRELTMKISDGIAGVLAQLVASALSAVHAGVSAGMSVGSSSTSSQSTGTSTSYNHNYSESGG